MGWRQLAFAAAFGAGVAVDRRGVVVVAAAAAAAAGPRRYCGLAGPRVVVSWRGTSDCWMVSCAIAAAVEDERLVAVVDA